MSDKRIAVIGMAGRFPGASTLAEYEGLLSQVRTALQPVPAQRWDHRRVFSADRSTPNRTPAQQGGFIDEFDHFCPEYFGISPRRARIMDPQQRLVLETTRQALDEAGYLRRHLGEGRTGVYVGASSSDHRTLVSSPVHMPLNVAGRLGGGVPLSAEDVARLTAAVPAVSGYTILGQQLNMIGANVSEAFDFRGPAFTVDTACSSALVALHEGVGHLRSGQVDAAVVGGVYLQLDPIMMVCFSRIGALSRSDCCRPFSTQADGFVLGEGVGVVVLKRLADALRDNDPIVAVVAGSAVNNDGKGGGALSPLLSGQQAVLSEAWRDAERDPAEVGHIEAHGTATPVGDQTELAAISSHFTADRARREVSLGAVKANIGHAVSAAGMASLIKALLTIRRERRYGQPGDPAERSRVSEAGFTMSPTTRAWSAAGLAGVSAFGFGGTNAHVVLEPFVPAAAPQASVEPVSWHFSAPDTTTLAAYLKSCQRALAEHAGWTASGVAAQLRRRETHAVVCELKGRDREALWTALARACGANADFPDGGTGDDPGGEVVLPPVRLVEEQIWILDEKQRSVLEPRAPDSARSINATESRAEAVWSALAEVTGMARSALHRNLRLKEDLGFDSLMALEFQAAVEKRLEEEPDFETFWEKPDPTVGGLLDELEGAGAASLPAVPPEASLPATAHSDWSNWGEIQALQARQAAMKMQGVTIPYFQLSEPAATARVVVDGQEKVSFSSYDYLGLARDPRVQSAVEQAARRWGASASASRIAAGERSIHLDLEKGIADFLGTEACLAMVGGYGTNVSVIGHLLGPEDLLIHDKLAHECILAGGRLSGAKMRAFKHNDPADLERLLIEWRPQVRRILVAVEGVYSMDGDLVCLPEVVALKQRYDALLMVDEAHSLGVVGETGRGVAEHFGIARDQVDLWMGTLSKSLASCGGYLAGARALIDYLRFTVPGFVFSVGIPPPQAAAALAALQVLVREPDRVRAVRARSDELRSGLAAAGLDVGCSHDSAVVPWIVGDSISAMAWSNRLGERGYFVQPIIAPAVDDAAARLRFFVTASHGPAEIADLVDEVTRLVATGA